MRLKAIFNGGTDEVRRLFVGCRGPADVLVYDTDTGRIVTRFATVGDTDDLFYDDRTRRLYASGGEGFLSVYRREDGVIYAIGEVADSAGADVPAFVGAAYLWRCRISGIRRRLKF
jgi:hypothetical protein